MQDNKMKYSIKNAFPKVEYGKLLQEAQQDMVRKLEGGSLIACPCCGRSGKVYCRHFTKTVLKALQAISPGVEVSGKVLRSISGDYALLKWWGLVEKRGYSRWALTARGEEFLYGEIAIPRTVVVFLGEVIRLEGPEIYVSDVGGEE